MEYGNVASKTLEGAASQAQEEMSMKSTLMGFCKGEGKTQRY